MPKSEIVRLMEQVCKQPGNTHIPLPDSGAELLLGTNPRGFALSINYFTKGDRKMLNGPDSSHLYRYLVEEIRNAKPGWTAQKAEKWIAQTLQSCLRSRSN